MINSQLLNRKQEIDDQTLRQALDHAVEQVRYYLPGLTDSYKFSNSEHNFYPHSENVEWTTGFWTGEIWLAYENSHDACFQAAALRQVDSFMNRIVQHIDVEHHDMGFLYSPSCVAAYKLTGSETGKQAALLAADNLISRFQEKGQFIQAWGALGAKDNYRLIIDCLLNLPLLYWATETTGDSKYADIAKRHIGTALKLVMREDYSTYHTYFFDPETGEPTHGITAQGYRNGSAWSRGQAWGIYGVALSYRYIKKPEYLDIFEKITDFFLAHLPENLIPYWDFDFTDGSDEPRDSSAAAIAVCGMLEMAKYMTPAKADYYTRAAKKLLAALVEHCAVSDPAISNGQLLHGTYARKSEFNTVRNRGVDECNTWGDYYYFEALTRLSKEWKVYW
ncbi:MAG: glycoside hydrolase family 88 protein [Angelakisella sp.]